MGHTLQSVGKRREGSVCESRHSSVTNPRHHRVFAAAPAELADDGGFGLLENGFQAARGTLVELGAASIASGRSHREQCRSTSDR
jgi:hypothetical protein